MLCLIIQINNGDVEQHWAQCSPLGCTANYWPSSKLGATFWASEPGCSASFQFTSLSVHQAHINSFSVRILQETVLKALPVIQVDNIQCSLVIYQASHLTVEGYQVGQA